MAGLDENLHELDLGQVELDLDFPRGKEDARTLFSEDTMRLVLGIARGYQTAYREAVGTDTALQESMAENGVLREQVDCLEAANGEMGEQNRELTAETARLRGLLWAMSEHVTALCDKGRGL